MGLTHEWSRSTVRRKLIHDYKLTPVKDFTLIHCKDIQMVSIVINNEDGTRPQFFGDRNNWRVAYERFRKWYEEYT